MNKIIGLYSNDSREAEQLIKAALREGYNQPVLFSGTDNHTVFTRQFEIQRADSVEAAQRLTIKRFKLKADFGVPDEPEPVEQSDCAVKRIRIPVERQKHREQFACDVVIPYNGPNYKYLEDSIKSILNQAFVQVTLHLINDGMEDDPIGEQYADLENVRYYVNEDGPVGPYVTLNRVFDYLEHDCFANQDSDDIALPHRLYKSMKAIEAGFDIVGGTMEQFVSYDAQSDRMQHALTWNPCHKSGTVWKFASPSGNVVNSTALMRKEVYEKCNGMAPWIAGADSEFYERAILAGYKAAAMDDVVALRRLHAPSLSNNQVTSGHGTNLREQIKQWTKASIDRQRVQTDHSIGGLNKHRNDAGLVQLSGVPA